MVVNSSINSYNKAINTLKENPSVIYVRFFKRDKDQSKKEKVTSPSSKPTNVCEQIAVRKGEIGEIGEYKINIQLDQLPKDYRYLSSLWKSKNMTLNLQNKVT
jgi:hypothetical protein